MEIKLKKSDVIFKLIFEEIANYEFCIEPKVNCSYKCTNKKTISTTSLKLRFIISVLLPITTILIIVNALLVLVGLQVISEGLLFAGILFILAAIALLIPYVKVVNNVLAVALGKKH